MNELLIHLKEKMLRAMYVHVLMVYEIAKESKPDFILEIGTGQAQSARAMLIALAENEKGKLVTVDKRDRSGRIPEELKPYIIPIVGDSHDAEVLQGITERFKQPFDMLLIDGDHSYEGAKKDFEMYVPLVKEGGLILMHDICNTNEGVKEFWKEIKYPKIGLEFGETKYGAGKIIPGMGIVQKYE